MASGFNGCNLLFVGCSKSKMFSKLLEDYSRAEEKWEHMSKPSNKCCLLKNGNVVQDIITKYDGRVLNSSFK